MATNDPFPRRLKIPDVPTNQTNVTTAVCLSRPVSFGLQTKTLFTFECSEKEQQRCSEGLGVV